MRDKMRWLAVPPALALLLMFGPWRDRSSRSVESPATTTADPQAAGAPATKTTTRPGIASAPLPDLTQVACTVAGVCLLGVAVVIALARGRRRPRGSGTIFTLRQSLRL